jgi:GTP-binding protein
VVGRSNVGKSSLLNALLGSADNKFVKVSRYPGSTAHLDFYAAGTAQPPALVLVDTPGYGYNKRGKGAESVWMDLLASYLRKRGLNVLPRALLLVDARLGLTEYDAEVMQMFDAVSVPYHVVMTKADEVSAAQLENTAVNLAKFLATKALPFPVLNAVSARDGVGIVDLHKAILLSTKLHKLQRYQQT